MSNNNLIPLALVAVGAVVLLNKAKATTAPAGTKSSAPTNTSMNGQLWQSLLGDSWKALTDAKNADGSQAFLMTNPFGQIVTSDGKPVGQEYAELFPATYGNQIPVDISMGGTDYMSTLFGSW